MGRVRQLDTVALDAFENLQRNRLVERRECFRIRRTVVIRHRDGYSGVAKADAYRGRVFWIEAFMVVQNFADEPGQPPDLLRRRGGAQVQHLLSSQMAS